MLPAISVLAASCAGSREEARTGEKPPRATEPATPSGRGDAEKARDAGAPGELDSRQIRAHLEAFAAEKIEAKKHYDKGNEHFVRLEFEKALAEYRRALELSPRDPEHKRAVAKAQKALGRRPAE